MTIPNILRFTGRYGVTSELVMMPIGLYKLIPGNGINYIRCLFDPEEKLIGVDLEGGPVFYIGMEVYPNIEIVDIFTGDNTYYFSVKWRDHTCSNTWINLFSEL